MILIRYWPESINEEKFDKLSENLWSLASVKFFSCVIARDPSSVNTPGHYALVIVPIEKQGLAEDILRKQNYTEYIFHEEFIYDNHTKTQLSKNRFSLNNTSKYVQFCLSEGTYVGITNMLSIKMIILNFR